MTCLSDIKEGQKIHPLVVGIAGGSGSGKTTVALAIEKEMGYQQISIIQHDSYYKIRDHLSPHEIEKINFDHPDALETDLLVKHLKKLISGKRAQVPIYDFIKHNRKPYGETVEPTRVIIVEGIFSLLEHELRSLMDLKIFVETDSDIRFIRRLLRDTKERGRNMESVIKQYLDFVRPMHMEFVEVSEKYADMIIPEGYTPASIEMIISMIKKKWDDKA